MYSFCNSTLTSIRGNCNSTGPGPRAVGAAGRCRGEGGGAGLAGRGAHGTCRAQRAATAGRCAGGGGKPWVTGVATNQNGGLTMFDPQFLVFFW